MHRSVGPSDRMSGQNCSGLAIRAGGDGSVPQNSMRAPSSRTRVDGMLKNSVAALAFARHDVRTTALVR
jgi:hypothetical protein